MKRWLKLQIVSINPDTGESELIAISEELQTTETYASKIMVLRKIVKANIRRPKGAKLGTKVD